jgi:tight adherence protein B
VTPTTFWLGRAVAGLVGIFVVALGLSLFGSAESPGSSALRAHAARLDRKLRFVRARVRAAQILAVQLVLGLGALGLALGFRQWALVLLVPAMAFGPKVVVEQQVARRVAKLELQIEAWISAIANALKASPSLGEAIASTTTLVASPMSEEVDVLVKEYELGTPLDRALDNLAERIDSKTLAGTVLALKVARKSGGNLPEMLENAAAALRELARLEGVVRTKTAEGKAQAFVIGAIPVPMLAGVHAMDEQFFEPLVATFIGNLVIAVAATLWAVAILLAKKILAVDV